MLSETYNMPTKKLPKPDYQSLCDYMLHFQVFTKVEPDILIQNTSFAAAAMTVRMRGLNMAYSCLAYFLATQGIALKSVRVDWEEFYRKMRWYDDWGEYAYMFSSELPYRDLDIELGSTIKVSETVSSELPLELVQHLENFPTMEESILEACRIMMLGPKTKRAESAVGSLINAWTILQKTK